MERTAYRLCHGAYSVPTVAWSVQHTDCGMERTAYRLWHGAYSIPTVAWSVQRTDCGMGYIQTAVKVCCDAFFGSRRDFVFLLYHCLSFPVCTAPNCVTTLHICVVTLSVRTTDIVLMQKIFTLTMA
jgi:hypothetical protein